MKVQRMSGLPVKLDQLKAYDTEFKERFDIIQAEVGTDMLAFHAKLLELDAELKPKYSLVEDWPLPRSASQIRAIIAEYETPIMFATSQENPNEVLLILMDEKLL